MAKTVAKTDRNAGRNADRTKQARVTRDDSQTKAELYARARMRDIVGASRMTKDELLLALRSH